MFRACSSYRPIPGDAVERKPMKCSIAMPAVLLALLVSTGVQASPVDALTLEDLQDRSALVVLGEVTDTEARLEAGAVVTHVEIRVSDCLTGLCPDDVTVTSPGGSLGGQVESVEGAPRFARGQEVLVFLRPQGGQFEVVGMAQGLFHVQRAGDAPVAVSDRTGLDMVDHTGRPALIDRLAYPLDQLIDGIRLGLPVTPLAQNF